jgi:CNT family concentrative nucleoside transporter
MASIAHGLLGLATILALAWCISEDRRRIPLRTVIGGIALQIALAVLLLRFPPAERVFFLLDDAVAALQKATDAGTGFVFGYLGGGPAPFRVTDPASSFILAFRALPLVLVIGALASLLFYWGILQRIVQGFAWLLQRSMGIGGALGLGAAVHIFVGMIEAPLLVRPYLAQMSRGELFALMTCGMAGIAGTMMVIYATILGPIIPNALGFILIASVISTPAGLAVAAIMIPFETRAGPAAQLTSDDPASGAMDAIVRGTTAGVQLLVNIIAMLVVLVALTSLVNLGLAVLPAWHGTPVTLQRLLGLVFAPLMWLIGLPWPEALVAGQLMGTKTVLNELVAYLNFAQLPAGSLSVRSQLMLITALCGFANLGSVGIIIGGMGAMIPERRPEVARLGMRSLISGTAATCMSAAVVGMLLAPAA